MSETKINTILILGARAPIALELCRSFGSKNYKVLCADSQKYPIARFSKYCYKYLRLSAPALDFEKFKIELIDLVNIYQIDHIIPTSEEAFYLSMVKNELDCKVWVSNIELMDQLHNKLSFIQLAKSYFSTPKTIIYSQFSEFNKVNDFVFKPIYSRFGKRVLINKSLEEINNTIKKPIKWIAQEKIVGKQFCSYSIFDNGILKSHVTYIPKYLYKGGASLMFEPIEDKQILEKVKHFGKMINYTGQLSLDFILKDHKAFVIECNPRGTSGAHLLAKHLSKSFLNKNIEKTLNNNYKTKALKLPILIDKPFAYLNKDYREAKDVIFEYNDLQPFFGQFLSIIELYQKKVLLRKSLDKIMTYEFEYNG